MKKIFYISGLGADETAFEKLDDFGFENVMVKWFKNNENESLKDYSQRIIHKYDISQKDMVVGLSFGGLIAQQIAQILGLKAVILISSFTSKADLQPIFRIGLKLKLFKLLPSIKLPFISEIVANYLNAGSAQSKPVINAMLQNTDMRLMKWSINKIYEHNSPLAPGIVKHNIIGTKDRIIGKWSNEWTYKIDGGSHFMVYEKSEAVSRIIKSIVN